jgi:putative ABC transport system permease protein
MIPFRYNARSLLVRKTTTLATAFGIALVVFVMASSLMLSAGIKKTLASSGRMDNAIVLRKGSEAELNSTIEDPQVGLLLAAAGVARDDKGVPIGVGEATVVLALDKLGGEGMTNVQVRGITDKSLAFRPTARVVSGRAPKPGSDEVLVGKNLQGRFAGFTVGESFELKKNRKVTVVGILEDAGSSYESEVWVDLDVIRGAFGREGTVSSVRVRLTSAAAFDGFRTTVDSDKNLGFEAMRETEYYEKQSENLTIFVTVLGTIIAFFFSVGAMIGAMITMYGSIANRQREIGTLRALGFSRRGILLSFLLESSLLALVGGALGAVAALGMKFVTFSMVNFATFSEMVFSFEPTPSILLASLVAGTAMGVVGGFFPAIRAARISAVKAMRA